MNGRVVVVGVMRSSPTLFENIPYPGNPTCYNRSTVLPDPPFVAFFSVVDGTVPFLSRTLGVSSWDDDVDVAVDELGNTYVAGSGSLYDYNPELNSNPSGAYVQTNVVEEDMFWLSSAWVMRLDGEANLTWFTPLGGPANEFGAYLAVDDANDFLYLAGSTQSRNYATNANDCNPDDSEFEMPLCELPDAYNQGDLNGVGGDAPLGQAFDGYLYRFKLDDMVLLHATYFGGSGDEMITDLAVDSDGRLYFTGYSTTTDYAANSCIYDAADNDFPWCNANGYFETNPSAHRQFIGRFGMDGALEWSTKVGDRNLYFTPNTLGNGKLAIDPDDNVFLYGTTGIPQTGAYTAPLPSVWSPDTYYRNTHNDGTTPTRTDTYVARFNSVTGHMYMSYFGGLGNDYARGVLATGARLYICGRTFSLLNFPTNAPTDLDHQPYLNETPQAVVNQSADGFIAQLRYDLTIGVREQTASPITQIVLYPNPALEEFTCRVPGVAGLLHLTAHDATGRQVLEIPSASAASSVVNVSMLSTGAYVLCAWQGSTRLASAPFLKY